MADVYSPAAGTYEAYRQWVVTVEGQVAFDWIERMAVEQLAAGADRVSPRTLVARARDHLHARINDHFTAWIADDLVIRHPHLLDVIERRKRRKSKF